MNWLPCCRRHLCEDDLSGFGVMSMSPAQAHHLDWAEDTRFQWQPPHLSPSVPLLAPGVCCPGYQYSMTVFRLGGSGVDNSLGNTCCASWAPPVYFSHALLCLCLGLLRPQDGRHTVSQDWVGSGKVLSFLLTFSKASSPRVSCGRKHTCHMARRMVC